jgi:hypothetical protein
MCLISVVLLRFTQYCEQWGEYTDTEFGNSYVTITFLKTFVNTKYGIMALQRSTNSTYPPPNTIGYTNATTTSVNIGLRRVVNNENANFSWKVYGYLAEGEY